MWQISLALIKREPKPLRVVVLPGGSRLVVTLQDYSWRQLYFKLSRDLARGWLYEPETTRFFFRWLRSGDTFFDVGANVGYYTALAASLVGPTGRVHAFEPNADVAALLRQTIAINSFKQVALNELAVSRDQGLISLYRPIDRSNTYESTTVPRAAIALERLEVAATTLDRYVERRQIDRVRLLKIDVEGGEPAVLAGADRLLRESTADAIVCEFAPRLLVDPRGTWIETRSRLGHFGYEPYYLDGMGQWSVRAHEIPTWEWGNICFLSPSSRSGGFSNRLATARRS